MTSVSAFTRSLLQQGPLQRLTNGETSKSLMTFLARGSVKKVVRCYKKITHHNAQTRQIRYPSLVSQVHRYFHLSPLSSYVLIDGKTIKVSQEIFAKLVRDLGDDFEEKIKKSIIIKELAKSIIRQK